MSKLREGTGWRAAVDLATLGPVGHVPAAPGTAGSLVGVALAATIETLAPLHAVVGLAALAVVIYACGVWAAGRAERFYHATDPSAVVIDEVAGQIVVFLARPVAGWPVWLAGFVLFRILDVIKPFPAGRAERLPGGWGIMTDDVVAGAYGAVLLYILAFVFR